MPASDLKITALTAIGANPVNPATFPIPMVDLLDNSMAASGSTRKVTVNQILQAGGTATLASATITGDLTVDTSTLKVDAANNRVGIGTASPIDVFQISSQNPNVYITDSSVAGSDQANLYLGLNTVPTYAGILVDLLNDVLNVRHNQATRLSIGSTGNVSVSTGNVVMATSGKGIDFTATAEGSGTMTSELLNDYEEGTWTPVVADAASGGNVGTSTIVSATYTKIGRQVSVEFYIMAIGTAGMTAGNAFNIRGLPFSATIQAQGSFYTYRVGRNALTVSSSAFVVGGNSYVQFFCFGTNSATTDIRILVSDIVSGTSELRMSVTYFV